MHARAHLAEGVPEDNVELRAGGRAGAQREGAFRSSSGSVVGRAGRQRRAGSGADLRRALRRERGAGVLPARVDDAHAADAVLEAVLGDARDDRRVRLRACARAARRQSPPRAANRERIDRPIPRRARRTSMMVCRAGPLRRKAASMMPRP